MSEWKEGILGSVLEVKYGKDHKRLPTGNIPCFGSGGLMRYVNEQLYDKESILIPRKGSLNNIMFQDKPFWTVDTMFWSKINDERVFPKFLFYQLTLIDYRVLNVGSAVPSLTVPVINEIDINLPPLLEQKAIAEVLSSLDDKMELLHRQNKTLEQMAETLFRQWFLPVHNRTQTGIEEAKDGWEDGCLGDIVDINPTYQLKKDTTSTYLEMKNLSTSTFNPEDWYKREFTSGMKFQNGDTLLARITPCLENGKTCFVTFLDDNEIGWGSTEYIVMRMKKPYHRFISYLIARDKDFRDFAISSMSGSSGRQRAQANVLKTYDISIPPKKIIEKLNNQLSSLLNKLDYNAIQIRTLEKMRDTLLPKLMSGEVRVSIDE